MRFRLLFMIITCLSVLSCQKKDSPCREICSKDTFEDTFDGVFFTYDSVNHILVTVNAIYKDSSSIRFVANNKILKTISVSGEILMINHGDKKVFGTLITKEGHINFFSVNYMGDYEMQTTPLDNKLINKNSIYDIVKLKDNSYAVLAFLKEKEINLCFFNFKGEIIRNVNFPANFNILNIKQDNEDTLQIIGESFGKVRLAKYDLGKERIFYDTILKDIEIGKTDFVQFERRKDHLYFIMVNNNTGSKIFSFSETNENYKIISTTHLVSDIGFYENELYISFLKNISMNDKTATGPAVHYETKKLSKWFEGR